MKKQQSYSLHIDSPCHEQWDAMLQVRNGKYCLHCAKTVIDCTNLTDVEIDTVVQQQHANGKSTFCGRFRNEQLNRALVLPHQQRGSYFALPVLIAGALATLAPEQTNAQEVPESMKCAQPSIPQQKASQTASDTTVKATPQPLIPDSTTIVGYVKDNNGKPLGGATIRVIGIKRGAISKADGSFRIANVPVGIHELKITYIGLEAQTILYNTMQPKLLNITLKATRIQCTTGCISFYPEPLFNPKEVGKVKHLKIDE
ncbi:MAG: carboxypeptidase-like regulatory domain-containing protein [Bacteriodetes bacterium]|nr:carboxypeptidase-like regulatory domain-containing protein [Bacteroidota bacterium]